ncbi:MFS transporter [Sporobolomyces salmoneus]|uniref:MFS transporter n=1 Tax=Sporobolomyces salmoneus TaxID=183962 RepID=UPI00317E7E6F
MLDKLLSRSKLKLDRAGSNGGRNLEGKRPPVFLRLRSSTWWIALTVGFGVLVDLSSYSIIVPVIPFRLEALGYTDIGSKTSWLVAAYAGGLIVSSPPVALLGAKYKNRQIPLILGLLFMVGAIVMFMEADNYALMVVARILQGISGTVLWTIGLALVTDSVPEARAGVVLGYVMIGFSLGSGIGPPSGGAIYDRYGWRGPFIFSIILIGIDLLMRLFIIEKHEALEWVKSGVEIKNFEAPGWNEGKSETEKKELEETDTESQTLGGAEGGAMQIEAVKSRIPAHWIGLWEMMKNPRALTSFVITLIYAIVFGGLIDSAMTIYLSEEYGLNSLGAGLVYLGAVVPTFFGSPLAGWWVDRYGTKWIMFVGLLLAIIAYPLLIIKGPLALFVFFLAIIGTGMSFFLTPVTVDLNIVASQSNTGITTAHVFGAFNMAFSIGSFIGPIIAGQILSHTTVRRSWTILTIVASGLSAGCLPGVVVWVGGKSEWLSRRRSRGIVGREKEEEKQEEVQS